MPTNTHLGRKPRGDPPPYAPECISGRIRRPVGDSFAAVTAHDNIMRFGRWAFERGFRHLIVEFSDEPVGMSFADAAAAFVVWMREMGLAGEYTDVDIRRFIEWWRVDHDVRPLSVDLMLGKVRRQAGVRRQRKRLKDLTGREKTVMWTIRETAEADDDPDAVREQPAGAQMELRLAA